MRLRGLIQADKFLCLLLLAGLGSCNSKTVVSETKTPTAIIIQPKDSFEKGVVIPRVASQQNSTQSYALYLPKTFNDSANLRCIVFFDPHGDGSLPVEKYKTLAEEFNFILIGSNDSRNENVFEHNMASASLLSLEAAERYHTHNKKISFCGFSGGAKVVLAEGPWLEQVDHIIYCGAALNELVTKRNLDLLGFAGTHDMNYTDVVQFDQNLKNSAHIHYLVEWNGKHEFPSVEVFRDAFTFIKTGNINNLADKQASITHQKLNEEQARKQELLQAFTTKDANWWKKEIAALSASKKTNAMNERLLGFISLACYSYANGMLQQNNLAGAEQILTIYALADPGNKDCEAFTAELKKRKGL